MVVNLWALADDIWASQKQQTPIPGSQLNQILLCKRGHLVTSPLVHLTKFVLFPSMPKQFLSSPVVYIIVGLYRTIHDSTIRVPVWVRADVPYSMKPKIDSHHGFRPSFDMD